MSRLGSSGELLDQTGGADEREGGGAVLERVAGPSESLGEVAQDDENIRRFRRMPRSAGVR